jgi:hypothetical protein
MRSAILLLMTLLISCSPSEGSRSSVSRHPLSVRGWVVDVKGATRGETHEMELMRRTVLFQSTSIWVEDAPYVSGAFAQNGSFVLLDVPHEKAILAFNAPGAETAQLVLENVPPGADVFIPDIVLENGGATVLDPSKIMIRVPAGGRQPLAPGHTARIGEYSVPAVEVPLSQMGDRRDFPDPGGFRPVATYR